MHRNYTTLSDFLLFWHGWFFSAGAAATNLNYKNRPNNSHSFALTMELLTPHHPSAHNQSPRYDRFAPIMVRLVRLDRGRDNNDNNPPLQNAHIQYPHDRRCVQTVPHCTRRFAPIVERLVLLDRLEFVRGAGGGARRADSSARVEGAEGGASAAAGFRGGRAGCGEAPTGGSAGSRDAPTGGLAGCGGSGGVSAALLPLFDPVVSPRNTALLARVTAYN